MTRQIKDKLIYQNEIYTLDKFLLKNQFDFDFKSSFSACWRGYFVTFEIINDKIFLNEIQFVNQEFNFKKEEILKYLVSDFDEKFLFKLNNVFWIDSENLKIVFEIKNGILTNVFNFSKQEFQKFQENQFSKYYLSTDYKLDKEKFIQDSLSLLKTEEKKNKWLNTIFNVNNYNERIKNNFLYRTQKLY